VLVWRTQWLRRSVEVPTTAAGVDRLLGYLVVAVRLGTIAQMVPAARGGVEVSMRPSLYATCWAVAALMAIAVSWLVLIERGRLRVGVAALDLAIGTLLLALSPWVVQPDDRVGSWVGFQTGYALSVAIAVGAASSRRLLIVGMPAMLAAYLYQALDVADGIWATVVGNLLTFVVYTLISATLAGYLRRLASDADRARSTVAELARREEQRRAQVVMHNGAALLRLFTEPELPDATRRSLVDGAMVELRRMRRYLGHPGSDSSDVTVADVVRSACESFADLGVETLLEPGIAISPEHAEALSRAVHSVLLNVREHANATEIVAHVERSADSWVLTISDDGVGFDPVTTAFGVGLREVVLGELARCGLEVTVESRPGEGTVVRMVGAA
jgi:signal transduction histidine kinase